MRVVNPKVCVLERMRTDGLVVLFRDPRRFAKPLLSRNVVFACKKAQTPFCMNFLPNLTFSFKFYSTK